MRRRGADVSIDRIVELDARRRSILVEEEELRARRNQVSRALGQTKERPPELLEEMRGVGANIKELEGDRKGVEEETNALLLTLPNLPSDDVPVADDESGNKVVRTVGELPSYTFDPLPHWELGERSTASSNQAVRNCFHKTSPSLLLIPFIGSVNDIRKFLIAVGLLR